jgi:hypothetical protein
MLWNLEAVYRRRSIGGISGASGIGSNGGQK